MVAGMNSLLQMRRGGARPSIVWLWIGFEGKGEATELVMPRPSLTDDFRPLVGLPVVMYARTASPELFELFEHLKTIVSSISFHVDAWRDDMTGNSILIWDRQRGQRTLAECCK